MAKARTQKLKVFRTAIGFHDAYVAAPSQKAALEAWGSDSNLFSAGAAEPVTEPELMKVPLGSPGEVIKVLRGTKAEQVAALGKMAVGGGKKKTAAATKAPKKPKPSREAVDAAEEALEQVRRDQAKAMAAIDDELAEIERRRRELARKHKRERAEAEEKAERELERYQRELGAWKKGS